MLSDYSSAGRCGADDDCDVDQEHGDRCWEKVVLSTDEVDGEYHASYPDGDDVGDAE